MVFKTENIKSVEAGFPFPDLINLFPNAVITTRTSTIITFVRHIRTSAKFR